MHYPRRKTCVPRLMGCEERFEKCLVVNIGSIKYRSVRGFCQSPNFRLIQLSLALASWQEDSRPWLISLLRLLLLLLPSYIVPRFYRRSSSTLLSASFPPFSLLVCLLDAFSTSPYSFYCHLFPFIAISSSSFSTPSFLQPNPPRFSSHPIALTSSPPHPSFASTHPRPPATPRLDVAMVTRLRRWMIPGLTFVTWTIFRPLEKNGFRGDSFEKQISEKVNRVRGTSEAVCGGSSNRKRLVL